MLLICKKSGSRDGKLLVSLNQWDDREHGQHGYDGVYEGFTERVYLYMHARTSDDTVKNTENINTDTAKTWKSQTHIKEKYENRKHIETMEIRGKKTWIKYLKYSN